MPETLLETPMTEDKPKTISVKLRTATVESARIVVAYTGGTLTDHLSDILDPILAKQEEEEIAKRHKPPKAKGGGKR